MKKKVTKADVNQEDVNSIVTPAKSLHDKDSLVVKKFSSHNGGLYQDNSDFSSYMTANSNKKRDFSNEVVNSNKLDQSLVNESKPTFYINRRESNKIKPKETQSNTSKFF